MSTSIMEALQNADYNIQNNGMVGITIAKAQLHNAVVLLDKDYPLFEEIDPLLDKYGTVESVPENVEEDSTPG